MYKTVMTTTLALFTIIVPMAKATAHSAEIADLEARKTLELNQQSKDSIASSWFEIPDSCKARVFNADPFIKDYTAHSSVVQAIFNSLI